MSSFFFYIYTFTLNQTADRVVGSLGLLRSFVRPSLVLLPVDAVPLLLLLLVNGKLRLQVRVLVPGQIHLQQHLSQVSHCSVAKRASARVTLGPLGINPAPFCPSLPFPRPRQLPPGRPALPAPSLQRPHVLPSETNHRERTASAAPGRTGQGTQISEPYKSTRPPRLSVSPSLAKSSQVPSPNFPSRAQILAPLVCIPVLRGVPHSTYLYLNSLDSTCLPTPPRPPLPIQQSTNPPSHPPIINPGLIPRRPASRHPPAARFAQHGAPWGNCACILGRAATAPLLHSRRRLFASPSPRLASTSDHLRIQSCLAPACLLLIWSLSGVNRIRYLPRCKTSTAFARIRASASTSAPCCTLTPRRQLTSSSPAPARDT